MLFIVEFQKLSVFPPCKGLDIHRGGGDLEDQTVKQVNFSEASLEFPLGIEGLDRIISAIT